MNSNKNWETQVSNIKMSAKLMKKRKAIVDLKKINNMKERFSKDIEI